MRRSDAHAAESRWTRVASVVAIVILTLVRLQGTPLAWAEASAPDGSDVHAADAGSRLDAVHDSAGRSGVEAVLRLSVLAGDSDPLVRQAAVLALGDRRSPADEAEAAARGLLAALDHEDADTREVAAVAAASLRSPLLRERLEELCSDDAPRVAHQALGALTEVGDTRSLPALARVLRGGDTAMTHRALLAIAAVSPRALPPQAGGPTAVRALLVDAVAAVTEVAQTASFPLVLRQHAVLTLGAIPDDAARASLRALQADPDPAVAAQATAIASGTLRQPSVPGETPRGEEEPR